MKNIWDRCCCRCTFHLANSASWHNSHLECVGKALLPSCSSFLSSTPFFNHSQSIVAVLLWSSFVCCSLCLLSPVLFILVTAWVVPTRIFSLRASFWVHIKALLVDVVFRRGAAPAAVLIVKIDLRPVYIAQPQTHLANLMQRPTYKVINCYTVV